MAQSTFVAGRPMSKSKRFTEFLYPPPGPRSVGGIIRWWEARRLAFNLAVGGAGLFSMGWSVLVASIPPFAGNPSIPWQVPVGFAVVANVCYLLGPTVEILIEKGSKGQALPAGPRLFRMGLTLSVGLALFPALIMSIMYVIRIAAAMTAMY